MAVYEYECEDCGNVTEKHCKINERLLLTLCPECGKMACIIPSVSSFHLKGGNWAKEGYGNKK